MVDDNPDALLQRYLANRDVPCPQCRYNLRDLTGNRCPECGEELELRVSPAEPRQAAPIAGLVILAAGAGLNALLLLYAAILFVQGQHRGWRHFVKLNGIEAAVMLLALCVWLANWRRIRRLATWRRWLLVAGCAMLTLADVIFFAKLIR